MAFLLGSAYLSIPHEDERYFRQKAFPDHWVVLHQVEMRDGVPFCFWWTSGTPVVRQPCADLRPFVALAVTEAGSAARRVLQVRSFVAKVVGCQGNEFFSSKCSDHPKPKTLQKP